MKNILLPPTPSQSAQVLAPIFSPWKDQQTKSFSFCENYKISDKKSRPIENTFNNINDYFKELGLGYLFNKHGLNQNGAKGQN